MDDEPGFAPSALFGGPDTQVSQQARRDPFGMGGFADFGSGFGGMDPFFSDGFGMPLMEGMTGSSSSVSTSTYVQDGKQVTRTEKTYTDS